MKVLIVIGVVLLALIVGGVVRNDIRKQDAVSNNETQQSLPAFSIISKDVASGGVLLDVRTEGEYTEGHIDGSVNFALAALESGTQPAVPKSSKVYVYCRSGNRSARAKLLLENAGYSNVVDLGAIKDVEAMGGVIRRQDI